MHDLKTIQQILSLYAAASIAVGCASSNARAPSTPPGFIRASPCSRASRQQLEDGAFGVAGTYTYLPDGLYKVFAAPGYVTDLALEPGEEVLGPINAGDATRWRFSVSKSVDGGETTKHVLLRPLQPGIGTNLILITDRRVYRLDLESRAATFMATVRWIYPSNVEPAQVGPFDQQDTSGEELQPDTDY